MRNSGIAALLIIFILVIVVIGVFAVVALAFYISGYNRAVGLEKNAEEAWANVDAQLQRRLDLIPNLVATVQGYASQEKEIFTRVAEARTRYFQAGSVGGKIEASNQLSTALSRLLLLQEAYPQLKANENFRDLQVALEGTENRIAVARTRYNQAAKQLNTYTEEFVGRYFARKAGVEPMPYFATTEAAREAPPKVDFSTPPSTAEPAPQPTP